MLQSSCSCAPYRCQPCRAKKRGAFLWLLELQRTNVKSYTASAGKAVVSPGSPTLPRQELIPICKSERINATSQVRCSLHIRVTPCQLRNAPSSWQSPVAAGLAWAKVHPGPPMVDQGVRGVPAQKAIKPITHHDYHDCVRGKCFATCPF